MNTISDPIPWLIVLPLAWVSQALTLSEKLLNEGAS